MGSAEDDNLFDCTSATTSQRSASFSSSSATAEGKRRVSYGPVTVYYFVRSQGFSCVPTFGGNTLGMSRKHYACRSLSLADHQNEIRLYRQQCLGLHQSSSSDSGSDGLEPAEAAMDYDEADEEEEEEDDEEEEEEDEMLEDEEVQEEEQVLAPDQQDSMTQYCSSDVSSYCFDAPDPDQGISGLYEEPASPAMPDEYYIQPLDNKTRRLLLKGVGVQLDQSERAECQSIRISRQNCGCSCTNGECRPETCSCAQDSIKCQVDRQTFPCPCTESSCGNAFGRVEFNATRVRSHFLTTMMRVRLSDKLLAQCQQQQQQHSPVHTRFGVDYESSYVEPPADDDPTPKRRRLSGDAYDRHVTCQQAPASDGYSITTLYTKRQRTYMGLLDDDQFNAAGPYPLSDGFDVDASVGRFARSPQELLTTPDCNLSSSASSSSVADSDYDTGSPPASAPSPKGGFDDFRLNAVASSSADEAVCETARA